MTEFEEKLDNLHSILSDIKTKVENLSSINREVLTFDNAKQYLNVSASYLYKLTSTNKIPYYKPRGKMLYFNKIELDNWLMQNPIKTASQIETEASDYVLSKSTV